MKNGTKLEKEGQNGLTGFQGQKPCKKFEGKRQKLESWSLKPTRRERKTWKSLNSDFEKVQFSFLKNLIYEFRSVKNQPRPVKTDRDSLSQILKILKISIGQKTNWIDRIRQRLTIFLKKTQVLKKRDDLTQSIEFWEQKCMSMRWYVFQIKNFKPKIPIFFFFLHSPQIFKQQLKFAHN